MAPTIDWLHSANNIILEQSRLRSLRWPEEQCPHYAAGASPVSAALWETACGLLEVGGGVGVVVVRCGEAGGRRGEEVRPIIYLKVMRLRVCGSPEHPGRPCQARSHDGGRGQAGLPEDAVPLAHLRLCLLRGEGECESLQPLHPPRPAFVCGWAGLLSLVGSVSLISRPTVRTTHKVHGCRKTQPLIFFFYLFRSLARSSVFFFFC